MHPLKPRLRIRSLAVLGCSHSEGAAGGQLGRHMPMMIRLLTAVLLLATVLALVTPHARAQMAACNWYADTAVSHQQRNEQSKCGFKGPSWSFDRAAHMTWCATQYPDRWKAEAQKREQMLAGCKK